MIADTGDVPDRTAAVCVREALAFARSLPLRLNQLPPAALLVMTPAPTPQRLTTTQSAYHRRRIDGLWRRPAAGICLRRSLTCYHFRGGPVCQWWFISSCAVWARASAATPGWFLTDNRITKMPQHYLNYAVMFTYPVDDVVQPSAARPPTTT